MVASGASTRSTDECEMSRSCHSATFSSAGTTAARTSRASPVRFSASTGLRLCGMADEPFWPGAKYSSASRTSVRCRWRTSIARFSIEPAMTPSTAKNRAWRSRGMTWVDELGGDVRLDPRIDVCEGADRARDGAGRDLAACFLQPPPAAGEGGVVPGELEAEGGRLGVDAVAAAEAGGVFVLLGAALQRRQQRIEVGEQQVARLGELQRQAGVEHVG